MQNKYEIQGDVTTIFLQRGMSTVIDTVDLPKACEFPNQWFANKSSDTETWYAMGRMVVDGKRKVVQLHRWLTNAPSEKQVDHFDHEGLNNRRVSNLRVVTQSQNQQNRKDAINKTGFRGVYQKGNKFKVEITVGGNRTYFGLYNNPESASIVASEARRRLMPFTQEPGQQNDALWNVIRGRYIDRSKSA